MEMRIQIHLCSVWDRALHQAKNPHAGARCQDLDLCVSHNSLAQVNIK